MKKMKTLISALMLSTAVSGTAHAEDNIVYLYNWSEYVPPGILEQFTKETGIKVISSSFESNETMYAKLKTMGDSTTYDVIAPSNYFVSKMRKEGMLHELDHSKLPSLKEIDPELLNKPFDPENKYSVPQVFGATGIAYNKDVIDGDTITSYEDLWNPKYKASLQVNDDARELFHIALTTMGEDPNTTDPAIIKRAYEKLLKLRPNILLFNSDNPATSFVTGEVNLGSMWNGSAYIARQEGVPVEMKWPKEGAILWMDTFAIPANAKHVDAAYKLINYLISAPVAEKVSLAIGYPTPNLIARGKLPKSITGDTSLYPPLDVMERSIWQDDVGDAVTLYENYYQKIKAAQ